MELFTKSKKTAVARVYVSGRNRSNHCKQKKEFATDFPNGITLQYKVMQPMSMTENATLMCAQNVYVEVVQLDAML
jgi:ribosomal protein S9